MFVDLIHVYLLILKDKLETQINMNYNLFLFLKGMSDQIAEKL